MAAQKTLRYVYFNARSRGELPRLVRAITGIEWTEEFVSDEHVAWPRDVKPKTPFGQLPCLIVDGKWFAQKLAISFYLAEIGNSDLLGKNPDESLEIHQCLFLSEDVLEKIVAALANRDIRNKGSDEINEVRSQYLPIKLPIMEKRLRDIGTGYFATNRMTIADLSAFDAIEHVVDLEGIDYLTQYPCLKSNFERTANIPSIKEYRSNGRNKTPTFNW